ncbi:MAG: serine/threonine-protein phosphatase [Planctomycetes bacterium]|nr:serine/threonine-protein phosphatase [Planctomycetota bacterium]
MMAAPKTRGYPQRRSDEWVPELCTHFSNATGWPLRYIPADQSSDSALMIPRQSCWQTELRDGQQLLGQLRLDLPHERQVDRSFAMVSQLSQGLADLVQQVFSTIRQSDVQTLELEPFVNRKQSVPQGSEMLGAIKQLLRAGLQLTGFRSAGLFLMEPSGDELRLRVSHRIEFQFIPQANRLLRNEPPDLQVLSCGTHIVLRRDDGTSNGWLPADASIGFCLPVQAACGVLGTLWFFDRRQRILEPREKQLLDSLSFQIASLLEQVVWQRESATHQRLRNELLSLNETEGDAPARTLRRSNFEAAWRVSSRFEIGGDLCEIRALSGHEIAIFIGDATGNSVPAAVVMTGVHGALEAQLASRPEDARDTARVLELVNRSLFHTRRLPHFMSLVYGVLNTQTNKFTYTNAGHPSPLLLRGDEVISVASHDLLLGIVEETKYTSDSIELQPRDVLVCYSDGVSETRSVDSKFFGIDGILRSLEPNLHAADTLTLLNRVWNRQSAFAAPGQVDDRSLLIARLLPE